MSRVLIFLVVFFTFVFAAQEQEQEKNLFALCKERIGQVCIFPPLVGRGPSNKPSEEFIENLREFYKLYTENLRRDLLISDQPENFWWVTVLLRPRCSKKKWCIEVDVVEEKQKAKVIRVIQIFLEEGLELDADLKAKEAAGKTRAKIFPQETP